MHKNKYLRYTAAAALVLAGISFIGFSLFDKKITTENKVCRSEYAMSLDSVKNPVSSSGVFYLFSENNDTFVLSVNGKLVANDKTYTISRRIYYKSMRGVRENKSEFQSSFLRSDKFSSDDAPDELVDRRLFGTMDQEGSKYKVEKIDNKTLAIGTYFTPLYVCQFGS